MKRVGEAKRSEIVDGRIHNRTNCIQFQCHFNFPLALGFDQNSQWVGEKIWNQNPQQQRDNSSMYNTHTYTQKRATTFLLISLPSSASFAHDSTVANENSNQQVTYSASWDTHMHTHMVYTYRTATNKQKHAHTLFGEEVNGKKDTEQRNTNSV